MIMPKKDYLKEYLISHRAAFLVVLFFGILYSSISLVNHYNFRTYAWDLGINNNAIYDYAHFRWNDCMLLQPQFKNVLGDHLTLLPILVSPLYWIFGSYTMLIFQIISILFGGYGIYVYFLSESNDKKFSLIAMIFFFSIWGIYSALAFDYHDNVVAAMLVPWFIYYFKQNNIRLTFLFFVLICISKENMALWMIFIALGLMVNDYKSSHLVKRALLFTFFAAVYFVVAIKFIIPILSGDNRGYLHFNYNAIGNNISDAIINIITKPKYVFSLLFENGVSDQSLFGIKSELHYVVLLSGGIFLILRPQYLIMLIPIYAQKLLNDDFAKWGINYQYSIEFVPILALASFSYINQAFKNYKTVASVILLFITMLITAITLDSRVSKWFDPEQYRFYQKQHYVSDVNVNEINKALAIIPSSASVSASSRLVPHLSFRDYIYQFPVVENAEYIVILDTDKVYPLSAEELQKQIKELKDSKAWELIYNQYKLLIFRKSSKVIF